jgi:hypothetical protein
VVVLVVEDQVPMKVQVMPQLLEPQTRVEEAELAVMALTEVQEL